MSGTNLEAVRSVIAEAIGAFKPYAEKIQLTLPGPEWEPFPLSTGAAVFWKSEPVTQGRMVRFRATGPCAIGYHFHDVPEVLVCTAGLLFYSVGGARRALLPGETFTSQPHELHSASFESEGEALAHWTDQSTDTLEIGYFPS